jgi:hypothetical protein
MTGEKSYQHMKTNFPTQSPFDEVVDFYFCCDNEGPDGGDVEVALADRMGIQSPKRCVLKIKQDGVFK